MPLECRSGGHLFAVLPDIGGSVCDPITNADINYSGDRKSSGYIDYLDHDGIKRRAPFKGLSVGSGQTVQAYFNSRIIAEEFFRNTEVSGKPDSVRTVVVRRT